MVEIKTLYGTPWCSDCKRSKTFLGEQRISYDWVDIDKDEEAAKFVQSVNDGKRKVPTIVFSDDTILVEPSNAELAAKLGITKQLDHEFHDLVIIGGGPSGLTSALYSARDGLDVVILEKGALGGQAGYTQHIDNYPGFPDGIAGEELAKRVVEQCNRVGVELLEAVEVSHVKKEDDYLVAYTSDGSTHTAKAMILATGTKYRELGVPGERDLIGYKVHFCATCDFVWYRDQEVVVVGGGNSAFEESLFLARHLKKVTILVRSEPKASRLLQEKVANTEKIEVIKNVGVEEFLIGDQKSLAGVRIKDRKTGEEKVLHPQGVFLFIGLTPLADTVKDLVDFEGGFVKTDATLMTKTPGLFASGDVRNGSTKQAVSAMGEGATAALMIREYLRTH